MFDWDRRGFSFLNLNRALGVASKFGQRISAAGLIALVWLRGRGDVLGDTIGRLLDDRRGFSFLNLNRALAFSGHRSLLNIEDEGRQRLIDDRHV